MSTEYLVPEDLRTLYHVKEWRNATGVLATACSDEWEDVQAVLRGFRLMKSEVLVGGGNRSLISRLIDEALYAKGLAGKILSNLDPRGCSAHR
jgi:Restriction endonuclease BglII